MKKYFYTILAIIICASLAAGRAYAADPETKTVSVFEKADDNKDVKVTPEEVSKRYVAWFKELDKDGNGKVTAEEVIGNKVIFTRIDVNKDGVITHKEFIAFFAGHGQENIKPVANAKPGHVVGVIKHERVDRDKNGHITAKEIAEYYNDEFAVVDTNKDGKIDGKEYAVWRTTLYKSMDKKSRGYVTAEDMGK